MTAINTVTTPRCKKVLRLAERAAESRGDRFVAPGHLLLAIVREGDGETIRRINAMFPTFCDYVENELNHSSSLF